MLIETVVKMCALHKCVYSGSVGTKIICRGVKGWGGVMARSEDQLKKVGAALRKQAQILFHPSAPDMEYSSLCTLLFFSFFCVFSFSFSECQNSRHHQPRQVERLSERKRMKIYRFVVVFISPPSLQSIKPTEAIYFLHSCIALQWSHKKWGREKKIGSLSNKTFIFYMQGLTILEDASL